MAIELILIGLIVAVFFSLRTLGAPFFNARAPESEPDAILETSMKKKMAGPKRVGHLLSALMWEVNARPSPNP